jgi:hypothetical protein
MPDPSDGHLSMVLACGEGIRSWHPSHKPTTPSYSYLLSISQVQESSMSATSDYLMHSALLTGGCLAFACIYVASASHWHPATSSQSGSPECINDDPALAKYDFASLLRFLFVRRLSVGCSQAERGLFRMLCYNVCGGSDFHFDGLHGRYRLSSQKCLSC